MKKADKMVGMLLAVTVLLVPFCGCTAQVQVTSAPTETVQTQNETGSQPESTQTQENPQSATNSDDRWAQMQAATLQYPSSNDEWEYNVYDCYVELTKYIGDQRSKLIIPDTVDGLPVWVINAGYVYQKENKKSNNSVLTSVTLPESLLVIGEDTFCYSEITNIALPESLNSIEKWAFRMCPLEEIEFPENLKIIGEEAFAGCGFQEVTIPASVVHIERQAIGFDTDDDEVVTVLSPNAMLGEECFEYVGLVRGYAGSTAAQYCAENGIKFQVIE